MIVEGCYISEWLKPPADSELSIARARVPPGVTTRWHVLDGVTERYLILAGAGLVEVGDDPPAGVTPYEIVMIPAGVRQRIRNTGEGDLVFLALCTPPFTADAYHDVEPEE